MTPTDRSSRLWYIAILPGLLFAVAVALVHLSEFFLVGIVADPAVVASYHFGSEPMVEVGGWRYSSPLAYAGSSFVIGVLFLGASGLFLGTVRYRHLGWLVAGYLGELLLFGFIRCDTWFRGP